MGFEVGKQITSVEIQKADFKQADGIKKLKDNEFEAIWNRFDTNNDGKLDQSEQVGLMAFIQNMAGEDGKITRKEVKNTRNTAENKGAEQTNESSVLQQFGDGVEISYKDMKRLAKGFQEFVQNQPKGMSDVTKTGDNTFEIVKANDKTVYTMDGQGRIAKRENEKAGTTTYTYNNNNDVHTAETTKNAGKAEQAVTTNTYIYPKDKKDTPPTELQQKIVEGNDPAKQRTIEQYFNILEKDGQLKYDKTKARVTTGTGESQKVVESTFKDGRKTQQTTTDKNGTEIINYQQVTQNGEKKDIPLTRTYTSKENPPTVTDEKYQQGQAAGNIASRTITKGGKKVRTTTYNPGGATVTEFDEAENPKEKKVTKYAKFDSKTGKIEPQNDSNKVEEVITQGDKRITNKYKNGKISNITTQFTDSKSPIKSVEQDIAGKTIRYTTKDGKTITVKTNDNGDPTTFPRFKGTRMETAEEIADRLGLQGEAKKAFITANRGKIKPGVAVSVPKNHAINANFKAENVETDGAAEAEKLKKYQAIQRQMAEIARLEAIAREQRCGANYAKSADNAIANWDKKGSTRATYATDEYRVFCDQQYNRGGSHKAAEGKDFQQHYIYSTYYNRMVKVEDLAGNIPKGEHVTWMSATGTAKLTNGKTIQLALDDNKIHGKKTIGGFSADSPQAKAYIEQLKARLAQEQKDFDKMVNQDKIGSSYVSTEQFETQVSSQGKTLAGVAEEEAARQAETARTTSQNYITGAADDIWTPADGWSGGDDAVRDMSYTIRSRITTDNVVEIYETYQKRHTADTSMIDTMTSESIGISDVGSRGGREHAYKATEHIINKLQDRALKAGVEKSTIDRIRSSFDHVNWFYYFTVNDMDDDKLTEVAQPVISQLITEIKSRESLKTEDTSNSDQEAFTPPPVTVTDETAGSDATTATTAQTTTTTGAQTTTGAGTTTQTATNTQTTVATNLTNVPILRNQENELPDYSRTHKGLLDNFESIPETAKAEIERVMDQHHLTMVDMPANVETPVMKDKDGNYYRLDMAQRKLILDGQPQPGTNPVDYYTVQI
ncbi:MAG: EF-hand domain-containing protein [Cyanobacteria bacterium RUI128]|nr:EF-hand domain-containing protein [Cyanobacteria bacterium RUI128]